ncbi:hypothetical protein D3C72_650460 [compost metagenome]
MAVKKPRPTWPSTFSLGTRTFSKVTVVVPEAARPILCSLAPEMTPGPRSTTKAVTPPLAPRAGSVTAKTVITSAMSPLVIQIFSPFRIQSLPSRTARVLMAAASEPAPVSVSAKQPMLSAVASLGRYLFLMKSEPSSTRP